MAEGKPIKTYQERDKNTEIAYKFYLTKGYTPAQASAIVGNLLKESGLKTTAEGDVGYKGGSSFGVAQWRGERLNKLKSKYGKDWTKLENQLDYVDWELNNTEKSAGDKLKKANSVWEAGAVFTDAYERPKVKFYADDQRQQYVTDVYRKHGKMELTDADRNMFKPTFAKDVAPYMNQSEITTPVTNFDMSIENSNFVSVPETKQQTIKQKDSSQAVEKLKEEEFIKEYKSFFPKLEAPEQEQVAYQQIKPTDVEGIFNEVSQFVDSDVAQSGGIPISKDGVFASDDKPVIVPSPNITMQNVSYPILGISQETKEQKLMQPGQDYFFKNTNNVLEIPQLKQNELEFLKSLR